MILTKNKKTALSAVRLIVADASGAFACSMKSAHAVRSDYFECMKHSTLPIMKGIKNAADDCGTFCRYYDLTVQRYNV